MKANTSIESSADLGEIIELADQAETIDHQQISHLTKLILSIRPEEVDEQMQAKLAGIMLKVKAQYA